MKYPVERTSGGMMYLPSFINISSDVQKLLGGIHTQRKQGDFINLLLFLQNKESRQKTITFSALLYRRCFK
jgi:hypothetical protein